MTGSPIIMAMKSGVVMNEKPQSSQTMWKSLLTAQPLGMAGPRPHHSTAFALNRTISA
jgi:hypothetical protein